jgi:hypothetical protein
MNYIKISVIRTPQYCFTIRVVQIRALSVYLSLGQERTRPQTGTGFNKQQEWCEEEAFEDTCTDQAEGKKVKERLPLKSYIF